MANFELYSADGSPAVLDFGMLFAGITPSLRRLKIRNVSGETITNCEVIVTNRVTVAADGPFATSGQLGDASIIADTTTDGHAVTFEEGTATGLFNLLIAGVGPDVYDPDGELIISARDLTANGITQYRIVESDPLQGFAFVLKTSITVASTGTLYASDGGDCTRLVDAASNETAGPNGITATQTGQAEGTILNNGEVEFSFGVNASLAKTALLNPRFFSLRVIGTKGAEEVCEEFIGSFSLAQYNVQALAWRISVSQPNYARPHYDVIAIESETGLYIEDPANPGQYEYDLRQHYNADGTKNNRGLYIEDPENPGTYILDTVTRYDLVTTPNASGAYVESTSRPGTVGVDTGGGGGNYPDWRTVLAANGVEFS